MDLSLSTNSNIIAAIGASTFTIFVGSIARFVVTRLHKKIEHADAGDIEEIKAKAALFSEYNKLVVAQGEQIKTLYETIGQQGKALRDQNLEIEKLWRSNWDCEGRCNNLQQQVLLLREQMGLSTERYPTQNDLRKQMSLPTLEKKEEDS